MKKFRNLRAKIWKYFVVFTLLILALLWLFLFVFLDFYYQSMKTRQILEAVSVIKNSFGQDGFSDTIKNLAYKNNMCIEIVDKYGTSLYTCEMMAERCIVHSDAGANLYTLRNQILDSEKGEIFYSFETGVEDETMLVYGKIIGTKNNIEGFIFLNTMLEPVESTTAIIKKQLFYITILIFEIALIITIFISKRISQPIASITKSAQKFAKGDYSTKFNGAGYSEAEQLAQVLNYAGQEVSKVDNLRRELVSNISHDLRTPLTIIKSYAEMVRDLSGENPEKRNEHIKVIIDESDRLTNLVGGLLELSKMESGNSIIEVQNFSINQKIIDVLNRYEVYAQRDGYVFDYISDEDVEVVADIEKIDQVLYNFINNAVNYTGEDKSVTIKQINKDNFVRIEITDTGEGIAQERLPLIFDRYYRDKKTERDVVGTGIGLSIVKQILKLHEFPFGVSSTVEKGSTFWFEIKRK